MTGGELLIVGNFNIHMDEADNPEKRGFSDMLSSYDLKQHVQTATHCSGHMLDLVITRGNSNLVASVEVTDQGISDHFTVSCDLNIGNMKKNNSSRVISYRSLKKINVDRFSADASASFLSESHINSTSVNARISAYNETISSLVDKHAPLKTKQVPVRHHAMWYTDAIRQAKQRRRQCERRWRKSRLTVHRDAFIKAKQEVSKMIRRERANHYRSVIEENKSNPKKMFTVLSDLLGKNTERILPPDRDPSQLASEFSSFFVEKIEAIKASIESRNAPAMNQDHPPSSLSAWNTVSENEVRRFIMQSPSKHCPLDPLPTWLLKLCLGSLLPSITNIINESLLSGVVPAAFKTALITPLLKKPSLDPCVLANYRPVSNLPFLSKVLERVVLNQLNDYIASNNLQENLQSAYRQYHSTETALVRVHHDILLSMGQQKACLLVLLDLTAAFDTVDHALLLDVLGNLGVSGAPLQWFTSYLKDREQVVSINDARSDPQPLYSGVPQGSVLGPVLFTLYTASLGRLISSFGFNYHFYADDTSLYLTFEPAEVSSAVERVEECVAAVRQHMGQKMLKMNNSKTEVVLISSRAMARRIQNVPTVTVGDDVVSLSEVARYIGVDMDKHLTMENYVNAICKVSQFHLYKIGRIRHLLDRRTCEQLTHAFISSKLDYANAVLCGLPQRQIQKLQRIQNQAARVVSKAERRNHITPVLRELHWLPVAQRIEFKICLLVFKCVNGIAPEYLSELIHYRENLREHRSSNQKMLHLPASRSSFSDRAFGIMGPKLWNGLDLSVKNCTDVKQFKQKLKTHFFRKAFL